MKNIKECRKSKTLFCICLTGFVLSLSAQIVVSNVFAVKGAELSHLIEKQKELEKDIYASELKLSQLSSLSYIERSAIKSGFVTTNNIVYLDNPTFAANLQ